MSQPVVITPKFNIGDEVYHKVTDELGIIKYYVVISEEYFEYGIVWESTMTSNHSEIELITLEEKNTRDLLKNN